MLTQILEIPEFLTKKFIMQFLHSKNMKRMEFLHIVLVLYLTL